MPSLLNVIHDSFTDERGSMKNVASAINKPYTTLMREVNPWDKTAKLGAGTFFEMMKHTHNVEPLKYMAEQLGYTITPVSQ